jgi:hypothetical protein
MNAIEQTVETASTKPITSEELDMGDLDAVRDAMNDPNFIWVL